MQINGWGNPQFSFALLVAKLLHYANQGMIASLPFCFHGKPNTEALQESGCNGMKNGFKAGIVLRSFDVYRIVHKAQFLSTAIRKHRT